MSGHVRTTGGTGITGVSVAANNGGGLDTTDGSGYYELTVPYDWSGNVTPSKTGYTFDPVSRSYSNVTSDDSGEDYTATAPTPTISGHVRTSGGAGISGASVSANNGGGSDTTDGNGYYELTVPHDWTGVVTPAKTDYTFDPTSRDYSNVTADQTAQDYTGTTSTPVISGYIRTSGAAGIDGASASADNGGGSDTTDATGYYELTVPYDWSGTVTPSKADYTFEPATKSYSNVTSDQTDQDYTGSETNPCHTSDYREPEWVIDGTEANRVLAYWRAGAYHIGSGADGYAPGPGDTNGARHKADYREPYWVIDGTEANRVLAYWRAGGYHVGSGADGYAPGPP